MISVKGLEERVERALAEFVEAAKSAFGNELLSVVLFGSAAEGALRATSDVNLILVLRSFDRKAADAIHEALQAGNAQIGLQVMFLLEQEIAVAAEAFAVKFSDILTRRRVLWGSDPFVDCEVSRHSTVSRVRQVLMNTKLRLRERYVAVSARPERLVAMLAESAGSLRSAAHSLLKLEGKPAASPREALRHVAGDIGDGKWQRILDLVSEARSGALVQPEDAAIATFGLMELCDVMLQRVAKLS